MPAQKTLVLLGFVLKWGATCSPGFVGFGLGQKLSAWTSHIPPTASLQVLVHALGVLSGPWKKYMLILYELLGNLIIISGSSSIGNVMI